MAACVTERTPGPVVEESGPFFPFFSLFSEKNRPPDKKISFPMSRFSFFCVLSL